jgi:hypothetical protein
MRCTDPAGEAGVREGSCAGVGPTARYADDFRTGSTTLKRFGLSMPSTILKTGAVGKPELIYRFRATSAINRP